MVIRYVFHLMYCIECLNKQQHLYLINLNEEFDNLKKIPVIIDTGLVEVSGIVFTQGYKYIWVRVIGHS